MSFINSVVDQKDQVKDIILKNPYNDIVITWIHAIINGGSCASWFWPNDTMLYVLRTAPNNQQNNKTMGKNLILLYIWRNLWSLYISGLDRNTKPILR